MINILSNKYDRQLLIYLLVLIIFGIVMLYSASWYESFANSNGETDKLYLKNHLKRLAIGSLFFLTFLLFDYRKLKVIAPYLIMGPGLFTGLITLGVMVQVSNAFSRVHGGFALFLHNWTTITELRSIYKRLSEFEKNLEYYKKKEMSEIL